MHYFKCGLLGEKLKHSFSPSLHQKLGFYEYKLYEKNKIEAIDFLKYGDYDVLNVTVPYKELAFKLCNFHSHLCQTLGNANIVVKNRNTGKLYGYNSDFEGFKCLVDDIDICGKTCVIFGTGGASKTVKHVLSRLGAASIINVSRNSSLDNNTITYSNLPKIISSVDLIVNTTPVGMFPNVNHSPIDLELLNICSKKKLLAVVDLIYNPQPTKFLSYAANLGFKTIDGMKMLIKQAELSSIFMNGSISSAC